MKWRRRCGLLVLLIFLQANGVGGFRQLLRKLTFAKKKVNKTLQEAEVELSCSGSHRSLGTARCIQYSDHLQQESAKAKSGLRGMLSTAVRYLSTVLHGVIFSFIMRIFNRFTTKRKDILLQHVFEREAGQGLLTVSNHQSVLDDPGLWAALLPWWRLHPDKFRWTICTEDVFFYKPALTAILRAGNVLPLDRNASRDQPMFQRFFEKLRHGSWCHIYAEGRVWQSWRFAKNQIRLGPLKTGVGKLIAHAYPNDPTVIPMYHSGMDGVIPEQVLDEEGKRLKKTSKPQSIVPRGGNHIQVYFGTPLRFHDLLKKFEDTYPGLLKRSWYSTKETTALYRQITKAIEASLVQLEREAFYDNVVIQCPPAISH